MLWASAPVSAADSGVAASVLQVGRTFNVCTYGATGNGSTLDTAAINQAIEACSQAGGGEVLIPAGRYLSGTVHLRSRVTLCLGAGATLAGTTNLALYEQPEVPAFMPEARWGKWHRALVIAQDAEDVALIGPGTIDGQKVFDPTGEEHVRGPHAINFINCRRFVLRDFSIVDAANYAIFFQVSDDIDIRNVTIHGGWDGVHFRGAPERWCRNVNIVGCRFYTGDDSIAGRYWDNVVIADSILNSSCNGLRLIGPATRLLVNSCLFYGPGQRAYRTSNRSNMLSGIVLQPGAWDKTEGLLDQVYIANITMRDVASPITIWTKPGNPVGRITIAGLNARGVYRSALSVESWSDLPITNVVLRAANIEYSGGGKAAQALQEVKGPGVDARPLPAWGVYARNVETLILQDVRLSVAQDDFRPVIVAEEVHQLDLDNLKFTHMPGVAQPLVKKTVGQVNVRDTDISVR